MWELHNQTPFAGERAWVRDKDGAEVWLVAIRGTFAIQPDGALKVADEQAPINLAPLWREEPGISSLLGDSDLVHRKKNTDVLIHGHVHAPGGKPVTVAEATLKVANIHKTVRATGDRVWERSATGLSMSKPMPFTKMPVIYERAFGGADLRSELARERGWEERNLIGTGFALKMDDLVGKLAPNIEHPLSPMTSWNSRPRPIGFLPIPCHWSPRVKYGGTYDQKWEDTRQPLLPQDFDERFHQCAPEDQQTEGFLRGGETVEITGMTPQGTLSFVVPRIRFLVETSFGLHDIVKHTCDMHTVYIEPDVPRVQIVWHTHLPCHPKVLKLLETTVSVKQQMNRSARDKALVNWSS